jgi:hypothetical protein
MFLVPARLSCEYHKTGVFENKEEFSVFPIFLPRRRGLRYADKIITSARSGPSLRRKEHCMAEYMDLLNTRRFIRD